jgi:hypothetical protein
MIAALSFAISSCDLRKDNEFDTAYDDSKDWSKKTIVSTSTLDGGFKVNVDMVSGDVLVASDQLKLNINISTLDISVVESVDMYILMQEEGGLNSKAPFTSPVKFKSFSKSDIDENGDIVVDITAGELVSLFDGEVTKDRTISELYAGDTFETYWVVKGNDGKEYNSLNLTGDYSSSSIKVSADKSLFPWSGKFEYEWTFLTPDGVQWGKVNVGDNGTIEISPDDANYNYSISNNFSFGYYYGANYGSLVYDSSTGYTEVSGDESEEWNITRIDDTTIEIIWMYSYTDSYNEWGKVQLKRTDGQAWPQNIHASTRVPN